MKIVTKVAEDGSVSVEVIDPSDGTVTHGARPAVGEQVVVTATTAHSPADIEFGPVEAIPEAPEQVDTGEAVEDGGETAEQAAEDAASSGDAAQTGEAEGAEAPADDGEQPPTNVADGASEGKAPASEEAQGDNA